MDLITTIGRFHPVLVHLPIGIFMTVIVMSFFSMKEKYGFMRTGIRPILFMGLISALLSLVSGYVLSLEGNNPEADVEIHKWTAIGTTLVYAAYYFFSPLLSQYRYPNLIALLIMLLTLVMTGHQGGSLTHGENYLWSASKQADEKTVAPVITDIRKAEIYRDIVGHTLQTKCVECHGQSKQKGKLRLDDPSWIEKGGKNGAVLTKGDPDNSELIKRILLSENDDHHMPPMEKTQLTTAEKSLLAWWVRTGASYSGTVESLKPDEKILRELESYKTNLTAPIIQINQRPPVKFADASVLVPLKKMGWVIAPVASNDPYLRAIGFNLTVKIDSALLALTPVSDQLLELKLSGIGITDENLKIIEKFGSLEKLWLDNNKISDAGVRFLVQLKNLDYLNLSNTHVSVDGIKNLAGLKRLRSLFVGGTDISSEDLKQFRSLNSSLQIYTSDSLRKSPTDTLLIKNEK